MKELYDNYYEEHLSNIDSQQTDQKALRLQTRKFRWNFSRFFKDYASDAKILDIGCGIGQFLHYLSSEGFINSEGIDISPEQVRVAKQFLPELDIKHVDDHSRFLKDHASTYDVIIMNDVLEHLPKNELIPTVKLILAALRPGGIFIAKTINAAYPFGCSGRYIDLTHEISFHEKSLHQLFRHCGFNKINFYQEEIGIYNVLFFIKKLAVNVVRGIVRSLIYLTESDWPKIISFNLIVTGKKI